MKLLFIIKKKQTYGYVSHPSGMANNTRFTTHYLDMLKDVTSDTAYVNDNNDIDREVSLYKPDYVFIEALWVVPEKFIVLQQLHPTVKWIIRIHSKIPFLSIEGMAFDWMNQLRNKDLYPMVYLSSNNEETSDELEEIGYTNIYLPNLYADLY